MSPDLLRSHGFIARFSHGVPPWLKPGRGNSTRELGAMASETVPFLEGARNQRKAEEWD